MKVIENLSTGGILNRGNARFPSGRIWPCQEFSLGYVAPRPDERLDDRLPDYCQPGDEGTAAAPPLDLRNVPNSRNFPQCPLSAGQEGSKSSNRPDRYGKKGITGYGRKMVKSAGALIDRFWPSHRVTFCTITMPTLSKPLRVDLAKLWPKLVNRLMEWLRRELVRSKMPEFVVSVTEIQPRRLEETGEGYLHLHLLWMNHPSPKAGWAVRVERLRAWLADWLIRNGMWEEDSHVNVDTRSVKGEKSRYLAKYASKGSAEIEEFARDCGWDCVPSQWWNCSNQARRKIKDHTLEGRDIGKFLDALINDVFDSDDFSGLRYLYHVDIEVGGKRVNAGWRGAFTDTAYDDIFSLWYNGRDIATPAIEAE
jgi:hypothetical protein